MTEADKNRLVEINELYKYLLFIYNETKNDFVTLPTKEFVIKKGNPKLLTKCGLLLSQEFQYGKRKSQMYNKYKWNKSIPTYKLIYDYYNMVKNNKNRYVDLENIVANPNEYNINQFNFALAVIGRHEKLSGYKKDIHIISTPINITNKPIEIKENQKKADNLSSQLVLPEPNEPNSYDDKLNEFIDGINRLENVLDTTKQQISEIVNLLKLMINTVRENTDITHDTYNKVASLQSSVGKTIAVSVTNQKNLFIIVPSLLLLFKDKYNTLNEELKIISPTHEDYDKVMKEKKDIDFGLNKIRGQLNENNNIEQKYR